MEFKHPGLRRFWERDDASRLNPAHVSRIYRILDDLEAALRPEQMDLPTYRLHQLTENRRGTWSARVSANWRVILRFFGGQAVEVDLEDYHYGGAVTARNPSHPGGTIRDCVEEVGWNLSEFAEKLGVSRTTASRLIKERSGISPTIALALERIGWSDADFWMRRQAFYDLAQARRKLEAEATAVN